MGYLRKRSRKRRGGVEIGSSRFYNKNNSFPVQPPDEKNPLLNPNLGKRTLRSVLNDPNYKSGQHWYERSQEEYDIGRPAVTDRPTINLSKNYDSDDDDSDDDDLPRRGGRRKSRKNKKSTGKRRFGGRRKTRRYRKPRK